SEHWEVEEFLTGIAQRETCSWCKHPNQAVMPKTRLCKHCNRLKLNLRSIEATVNKMRTERRHVSPFLDFELKVRQRMVAAAKVEGQIYGDVAEKSMTPLTLEHELRDLGMRYVRKDFFNGYANILNDVFCESHKRLLYYILSLFNREYLR